MAISALTPNLMVDDMPGALAFYRDTLGFEVVYSQPNEATAVWAEPRSGAASIMPRTRASLSEELPDLRERGIGATRTLYLTVDDAVTFDGLYERTCGARTVIKEPFTTFYGAREFCLRDSEGYLLAFACMAAASHPDVTGAPAHEGSE
jgi:uncharacterized glyoxalase superfamily protein PhnB